MVALSTLMKQIETHRQCAAVILTNDQGKVLLLRQPRGFYGLPGGIVDQGETPPTAAVREAREEVGVEVELDFIIGTYLLTGGGWPDIFASVYKAHVLKGTPHAHDPAEVLEVLWCSPEALPSPIVPDAEAAIADFLAGKRGVVRTYRRTVTMPTGTDSGL
ncbi:hypothetical protein BH24DEI2_BH24DEI2_14220 [soil metagenome]